MKLVAAWLTVALVACMTASGCSIRHTSDQFECTTQADCNPLGRTCMDGYCVVGPGGVNDAARPSPDASMPSPDARECPGACSSCDPGTKQCKIDCAVTSCTGGNAIVCPPGWNCEVLCSTSNSCRNGVRCANTLSCDVQCTGTASCRGVVCGAGPCNITCTGNNACRGVECGTSCACDVTCGNAAFCGQVLCGDPQCDDQPDGCTSGIAGCDTCP